MNWKQPGRARHVVIEELQGGVWEYARDGNEDRWCQASGWPNPTAFRSGPTMTSAELLEAIRGATEA